LTIPANGDRYLEDVGINSIYGFSGNVSMLATPNSSALVAQLGLTVAKVAPGSGVYVNITFSSFTVGAYSVNVTGTSGSLVHSVAFQILVTTPSVGDFAITANQQSLSMLPGNSTTLSVSVTSINDYSGPLYLNAFLFDSRGFHMPNDPFGPQVHFNTDQLSMQMNQTSVATLTVETSYLSTHGSYTIQIDAHGGLPMFDRYLNLTLTVLNPDFTVAASPGAVSASSGAAGNSTIIVRTFGLFHIVDLAVSVSPGGVNCTLSKTSTPIGGGYPFLWNSTLSCRGSPGTYSITITGKSGSLIHSATVMMSVGGSAAKPPGTKGFTLFGLSPIESYGILAGLIAILALTGVGIYSRREGTSIPNA